MISGQLKNPWASVASRLVVNFVGVALQQAEALLGDLGWSDGAEQSAGVAGLSYDFNLLGDKLLGNLFC